MPHLRHTIGRRSGRLFVRALVVGIFCAAAASAQGPSGRSLPNRDLSHPAAGLRLATAPQARLPFPQTVGLDSPEPQRSKPEPVIFRPGGQADFVFRTAQRNNDGRPVDRRAPSISRPPPSLGSAAGAARGDLNAVLVRRGDLSLRDTTLSEALFTIGESWGVNIVVGDDINGKVNGAFRNAPLHDILDGILLANGYGYRNVGDGIVVMQLSELGDDNPMFRTATVRVAHLSPADAVTAARPLLSRQGKIEQVASASSVIVIDYRQNVDRIRTLLETLDASAATVRPADPVGPAGAVVIPTDVEEFRLQYAKAEDVLQAVTAMLSPDGKAAVVAKSNRLVVLEQVPRLPIIRRLVSQLDQPRQQVRITALIYDISVQDVEKLGLNWSHSAKGSVAADGTANTAWSFDTLLAAPAAATGTSGVMTFMSLSRHFDFTSVVEALRTADDAKLLADPSVMVLDGEEASIKIVTEIPYQQLTETSQGGAIGTVAFREAGVTLKVAPHIAADGTMQMQVTPSFSRLAGFTTGDNAQPIIDQREAQTSVRVASGQTLVIGGLRQKTEVSEFNGIPVLKDIDKFHIGKLFQAHNVDVRESELMVFLLPEIVPDRDCMPYRYRDALESGVQELDAIPSPSGYLDAYERGNTPGLMTPCCERYPNCRHNRHGAGGGPGYAPSDSQHGTPMLRHCPPVEPEVYRPEPIIVPEPVAPERPVYRPSPVLPPPTEKTDTRPAERDARALPRSPVASRGEAAPKSTAAAPVVPERSRYPVIRSAERPQRQTYTAGDTRPAPTIGSPTALPAVAGESPRKPSTPPATGTHPSNVPAPGVRPSLAFRPTIHSAGARQAGSVGSASDDTRRFYPSISEGAGRR
jgi:general secretion pathway protein D